MLFPSDIAPGLDVPGAIGRFCAFFMLYLWALALIGFLLPRPWFVALLKVAFPFLPERLEDFNDKN